MTRSCSAGRTPSRSSPTSVIVPAGAGPSWASTAGTAPGPRPGRAPPRPSSAVPARSCEPAWSPGRASPSAWAFVTAMPYGGLTSGRRRPLSDEAALALADQVNLAALDARDEDDRGLRDIWETLITAGRRSSEIRNLRLDCPGRYHGLAMLWHDQAKVGRYDQAIRIPEPLYERLARRQAATCEKFERHAGRPPDAAERNVIALFPRKSANLTFTCAVSWAWFTRSCRAWADDLGIGRCVPHQARHSLATALLRNGATLSHVKRYLGQVSERMAEHYVNSQVLHQVS